MKKLATLSISLLTILSVAGCNTLNGKEVGTASGVAVGAVAGNLLTGGVLGTVVGGAAGGLGGYAIGKNYDQTHPHN